MQISNRQLNKSQQVLVNMVYRLMRLKRKGIAVGAVKWVLAAWVLSPLCLYAHVYMAPVDQASWNVGASKLMCSIWHEIPGYGFARFRHRAGENLQFRLETKRKVVNDAEAKLWAIPPAWKSELSERNLGSFQTLVGNIPIDLKEPRASRVLAELQIGMFPAVRHGGWFPGHQLNIQVSSVNFGAVYLDYLDCVEGLFPANFDQLERTSVLFDTDKWVIKPAFKDRLKLIKQYVDIDKRVTKVYVDGHTDSIGRMGYNWDLSRNRAEAVEKYMHSLELDKDMVVVRYHGEQYPTVKNNSEQNRSKNRRVTLRLEMPEAEKLKMR